MARIHSMTIEAPITKVLVVPPGGTTQLSMNKIINIYSTLQV